MMRLRPRVYRKVRMIQRLMPTVQEQMIARYEVRHAPAHCIAQWRAHLQGYDLRLKSFNANAYLRITGNGNPMAGRVYLVVGRVADLIRYQRSAWRCQRYPLVGEILTQDLVIQKGKTNLKVATNLAKLQALLAVRPAKGFVEIVETRTVARKGQRITPGLRELCTILRIKIPIQFHCNWLRIRGHDQRPDWLSCVRHPAVSRPIRTLLRRRIGRLLRLR